MLTHNSSTPMKEIVALLLMGQDNFKLNEKWAIFTLFSFLKT